MIFERTYDDDYHWWFAWRPVILDGPDEWDRVRANNCRRRLVWLRWILRWRNQPSPYYALPDDKPRLRPGRRF